MSQDQRLLIGASGWIGCEFARKSNSKSVAASEVLASRGDALRRLITAPRQVIVNLAGARSGDAELMRRLNAELPELLAGISRETDVHVVHLGSAAEYGHSQPDGYCTEGFERPESEYGRTKNVGTQVLLESGSATVLRVFNICATPAQPGSPLEDITGRVKRAIAADSAVELLSAGTVRDWLRLDDLIHSIEIAAAQRPAGVFNICSGIGISMRMLVESALQQLRVELPIADLGRFPATTVIGNPDAWRQVSGLVYAGDSRTVGQSIANSIGTSD